MATETETEIQVEIDAEAVKRLLPPYRVVLHNDDVNSMEHVVKSVTKAVPSITVEPKPRRAGLATGGPPLSIQDIANCA